jgi:hypothetical protein
MPQWSERRQAIADLNELAAHDIRRLLGDLTNTKNVQAALHDILPVLIQTYGSAAASLAADWYDDFRAQAEAAKRFAAVPAEIKDVGAHALVGWAAAEATDDAAFGVLLLGGVQRRIANFDRLTITGSSVADPSARGWMRVGVGECDFCQDLLDRGAVYSEATADFEAHDNCRCSAVPEF